MKKFWGILILLIIVLGTIAWNKSSKGNVKPIRVNHFEIHTGAEQTEKYIPLLINKRVALVVNHTSTIGHIHLLDTLIKSGIKVVKIFAPEHGFRGNADAGEKVNNQVDAKTNLPIISLYGKNKKPHAEQLEDVDILIFDMQDVGARFYTYSSTLLYTIQACSENNKPLIVLDRPNPNGHYVDGPLLDTLNCKSFVGLMPLPIVHGLTFGEMAHYINGELMGSKPCSIQVVNCKGYDHTKSYSLPIKPSPNLPNDQAIALYPSLCLFEGTTISIGRGTMFPFQVIGAPDSTLGHFTFTPKAIPGMDKNPMFNLQKCYGLDLRKIKVHGFHLSYLIEMYTKSNSKSTFFNNFFEKLIGNKETRGMIEKHYTEEAIRATWAKDLEAYKVLRKKYLLYKDFE